MEQMEQMTPQRLHHRTENNCSGWVERRCSVSGYNWVLFLFPVNLCQNMSTFSLFPVFHHHLIFQPLWRKVIVEWVSTAHWAALSSCLIILKIFWGQKIYSVCLQGKHAFLSLTLPTPFPANISLQCSTTTLQTLWWILEIKSSSQNCGDI